jgi:hypothetical protein
LNVSDTTATSVVGRNDFDPCDSFNRLPVPTPSRDQAGVAVKPFYDLERRTSSPLFELDLLHTVQRHVVRCDDLVFHYQPMLGGQNRPVNTEPFDELPLMFEKLPGVQVFSSTRLGTFGATTGDEPEIHYDLAFSMAVA